MSSQLSSFYDSRQDGQNISLACTVLTLTLVVFFQQTKARKTKVQSEQIEHQPNKQQEK
jgi:hypothetical protein